MAKRQLVQIPAEQVTKLNQIESIRKDLVGCSISKKVHILLHEKLKEFYEENKTALSASKKDGEWFEYIRDVIPLHVAAPIALGVVRNSQEMIGCSFTRILCSNDSSKTWWGNYKEDIQKVGSFLLTNLKSKSFQENYNRRYDHFSAESRNFFDQLRILDLSTLNNDELLNKYSETYERSKRLHGLTFDIDAMDICLEEAMKSKLHSLIKIKLKIINQSLFNEKYTLLTTPASLLCINIEQIELLRIAEKISKQKNLIQIFEKDTDIIFAHIKRNEPKLLDDLQELVSKYWWTTLGWSDRTEKTELMYVQELKKILNNRQQIPKDLDRLANFIKILVEKKRRIAEEYDFDEEIVYYLDVLEKYSTYHDIRKELQMKSTWCMNKFLFEISRRFGARFNDLIWCWPWEIQEYIRTRKIDFSVARKRMESYFIVATERSIEECIGDEAVKRRKEEMSFDIEEIRDFKGITACAGKVTGKVKVCFSASEAAKKIEEGDILVTSMTLPDYFPAMKRSAGIVTDEGGITSHAAVVARELNVPCVVGTRIATRVLKDGDMIELNANHGRITVMDT